MKFVIFTDNNYNYRKPMADGLYHHLKQLGHDVTIIYEGKFWLCNFPLYKVLFSDIYKIFQNIKSRKLLHITRFWSMITFEHKYKKKIFESDCLIVVDNCPNVFYRSFISRLELIRKEYRGPIVNYDLHYLPNQGWYGMIKEKDPNNFGLERFDWYLPASLVTEFAIPKTIPQIYDCIGFDIQAEDLFSDQKEFMAVLDFAHKGRECERAVQIEALEETKTPYISLSGKYTRSEIRSIYRRCNMFFTSVRESFSLPVLEIQLCGGLIATPYKKWLPAHFIDKNIYSSGEGELGTNFYVYDNDKEKLKEIILNARCTFDSKKNIENFKREYAAYYCIDDQVLSRFCKRIEDGEITGEKHNEFQRYNEYLNTNDRVQL